MRNIRWLAWTLVALVIAGCGDDMVVVRVKDDLNELVPDVEVIDAETHRYIGVTNRQGEVRVPLIDGSRLIQPTHPGVAGQPLYEFQERIHRVTKAHRKTAYLIWALRQAPDPEASRLAVTSYPEGAELEINGREVGPTPLVVHDFAPGSMVTLTFKLPGYALHRNTLLVDEGLTEIVANLGDVKQHTCPVELVSTPAGAQIEIDGRDTGRTTPAQFEGLSAGRHDVRLLLDGFRTLETEIHLERGARHVEHLGRLTPVIGGTQGTFSKTYRVSTSPHYAKIFIDGQPTNRNESGTFSVHLGEGMHRFRAVNDELGIDLTFRYHVRASDPTDELQIDLEKGRVVAPRRIRRKMYRVEVRPHWAEIYLDGEAFNRNSANGFDVVLENGLHRFHVVNTGTNLDTVLDYRVNIDDENNLLVLDWQAGSIAPK